MKLNGIQFGFCVSLVIHAAIFGAIALGGLGRQKPQLPEGEREHIVTLTLFGAPDEPVAETRSEVAQVIPTVPTPTPTPEPPKPVESKPPPDPKPVEVPVQEPEPTPLSPTTVPVQKQTAPQNTPSALALNQAIQNRTRGDGSSKQPGEDATTKQAPMGVRAQPDYRKNPEPPYPLAARRRRQEGVVLLSVKVSAQGRALRVELKQSSGVAILDEAAIQAVRDWEFEPARVASKAYESEIEIPVRFKLTN